MRSEEWMREREFETVREWVVRRVPDLRHTAKLRLMSSPCARCQAHGEHSISIFHVNETYILLNFFNIIFEICFEIENKTLKFTKEHEYNFFTHVKSLFHVLIVQIQFISIKVV